MTIIDSQVHAYEANTPKRPWHSVPKNAFTSTTSADARSVSLIAASAWGLETSLQNALAPPLLERASSAATGSSTSTER